MFLKIILKYLTCVHELDQSENTHLLTIVQLSFHPSLCLSTMWYLRLANSSASKLGMSGPHLYPLSALWVQVTTGADRKPLQLLQQTVLPLSPLALCCKFCTTVNRGSPNSYGTISIVPSTKWQLLCIVARETECLSLPQTGHEHAARYFSWFLFFLIFFSMSNHLSICIDL